MAGLYVHIPFCKSRCIYCGFYSTTRGAELSQRYVDALCREMELRGSGVFSDDGLGTIYIGGGTPSLLSEAQLEQLFGHIARTYGQHLSSDAEITIECNPDDVDTRLADVLSRLHVNRVSMGAQTFSDSRLRFLRRRHSAAQTVQAVARLRDAGIDNISIDLMFGFPGETVDEWTSDIDRALELGVEHLSAYSLMYEEGTALHDMLAKGLVSEADEELSLTMYSTLADRLTSAGYEHYEISNFARPGRRSRHNSNYWNQTPYVGIGAAAHSYDVNTRRWNADDVMAYIRGVETGRMACDSETLDDDTRYNDLVMTALRTCEGIDISRLDSRHRSYLLSAAKRYLADGTLVADGRRLRLSRRGIMVSDMIMADLMWVQ